MYLIHRSQIGIELLCTKNPHANDCTVKIKFAIKLAPAKCLLAVTHAIAQVTAIY